MARGKWSTLGFLVTIVAIVWGGACQDPPNAGQLIIDVDRLALRPGVTQVTFTANDLRLFYGQAPTPPAHRDVDCTSGQAIGFTPQALTIDLSKTGREYLATANAPPGTLFEIWLVVSNARVTENGLSRPLHTDLNCESGDSGVIRLTTTSPNGVQVVNRDATEIAVQLNPNTDIDHKDPDNAGGRHKGKTSNPDRMGDLHGGRWSIAESLPFVLVPPMSGTAIVDGQSWFASKTGPVRLTFRARSRRSR